MAKKAMNTEERLADMVGTQPVFSGGGGKAVGHIHRVGVAGCQKISKDPYQQEKNKHS